VTARQENNEVSTARPILGRRIVRAGIVLCLVGAFVAAAWVWRAPLLRELADLWVISDDYHAPEDAIVVLGGALETRPFAAAELYKKNFARQVLVPNARLSPVEKLEVLPRHGDLNREILLRSGVPAEAIVSYGKDVTNTYEEARAVVEWARQTGAKSVIMPTEQFASRRVSWIFKRELAAEGVRAGIKALTPHEYSVGDWWTKEGVIAFPNEVLKYLYYRMKY
jgi:uncharacterized SAM-binding protein YcdF (DUF218 family)